MASMTSPYLRMDENFQKCLRVYPQYFLLCEILKFNTKLWIENEQIDIKKASTIVLHLQHR